MDHQLHISDSLDRVIHIPLSEAEWQAFLRTTPKPVDWLREKIREAIAKSQTPNPKAQTKSQIANRRSQIRLP
jgi:hypothetical protein